MTEARGTALAENPKEHAMAHVILHPTASQAHRRAHGRFSLRRAIALLLGRSALDHIREPAGLAYPITERSKRLMRQARVCGW
jgi:hypothetical protein